MASSKRDIYCSWVENALKALGGATPSEVYRWIRTNEVVPSSDLTRLTRDGESFFMKEVRWARFTLYKAGIVSNREGRGIWSLA